MQTYSRGGMMPIMIIINMCDASKM